MWQYFLRNKKAELTYIEYFLALTFKEAKPILRVLFFLNFGFIFLLQIPLVSEVDLFQQFFFCLSAVWIDTPKFRAVS